MKNVQYSVASILISVIPNHIYLLKSIHCTQIHTQSSMIICSLHCAKPYPVSNVKMCIQWMKEATNKQIMQTIANIYRNAKPRKLFSYALGSDNAIKYTECVCFHRPTNRNKKTAANLIQANIWYHRSTNIFFSFKFSLFHSKMELIQKIIRSLVTDPCTGLSALLKLKF